MTRFKCLITFFICFFLSYIFSSCNFFRAQDNTTKALSDSISISQLLIKAYKWHENNYGDFDIIVRDTLQIGLDTIKFKSTIKELRKTNYFSISFIDNFERMGQKVDRILRSSPKPDEINFPFQGYDIWTNMQDVIEWDKFKIKQLSIAGDSATLKWIIDDYYYPTGLYLVTFKFENNQWKISSLEGFDYYAF